MKGLFVLSILALALPPVHAWQLTVWSGEKYQGAHHEEFHSNLQEAGCFEFNPVFQTPGGIGSFKFENDIALETFVLFDTAGCSGMIKGFSTGAWDKPAVTPGITLESFLVTGPGNKLAFRGIFFQVAKGFDAVGFKLAAELLVTSLSDNPSDVTYPPNHMYSTNLKQTSSYMAELENIAAMLATETLTSTSGKGSFPFSLEPTPFPAQPDFYFALHRVSYTYTATKSDSKWLIDMKVFDTYNFEVHPFADVQIPDDWQELKTDAKNILKNVIQVVVDLAVEAQRETAIVPFNVTFEVTDTI